MIGFRNVLRKFIIYATAIIAGICIFTSVAALKLENTLFDPMLQKNLMQRHDIYAKLGNAAKSYFAEYSEIISKSSSENPKQQEQLLSLIDEALTPEMIAYNIDSISDGLISYFKNETRFLPDISLKPEALKSSTKQQVNIDADSVDAEKSYTSIDRINLGILLLYMNRTDISDKLQVARLFQFALSKLPILSIILLMICLFIGVIALMKSPFSAVVWLRSVLLTAGSIFTAAGIVLFIYLYAVLSSAKEFKIAAIALPAGTLPDYIKDWFTPFAIFLFLAGISAILLLPMVQLSVRLAKGSKIYPYLTSLGLKFKTGTNGSRKKILWGIISGTVPLLLIIIFSILQFKAMEKEFLAKDLATAFDRMKGITAFSRVVYAQDAAIYSLEVRLVERKTGTPVQGIKMKISGKSAPDGKTYDESETSDMGGKAKAALEPGTFSLSFIPEAFPEEYIMPSVYYFEIKSAGTTVITIDLDKTEPKKPGIIEVLILGKDNQPVKGLELVLEKKEAKADTSSKAYSFTNADGIAVYSAEEGSYTLLFPSLSFPPEYSLPEPLNIDVESAATARYSLKLAEKAVES